MLTKNATEMRTIHKNPPTKEEFEIYEKVRLFYELEDVQIVLEGNREQTIDDLTDSELEVIMDEYEDALEYNSAPSAMLSGILSNVFDSVLG